MDLVLKDDTGRILMHLRQENGSVSVITTNDAMKPAAERWSTSGLREFTSDGQMFTAACDPSFIGRLQAFINRHTAVIYAEVVETPAPG